MICNTAVFYDVENLISLFNGSKTNKTLHLDEIYKRILSLDVVEGVSVQRAYADWIQQTNRSLRNFILQIGIEPIQIFNSNQNDKVKNAADISLIIDAVELLAKRPEIENYVIASGDGIFAFLAKKLHEYGKRVIGCGFSSNSNAVFKNACDIFIMLDKEDKALELNKNKPAAAELTPPKPAVVKTAVAEPKEHSKLPKNKHTEVLLNADFPIWKNMGDTSGSLLKIKQMINLLFEDMEADAVLEISLFKNYLDYYLPNFKIKQYGFNRFGEFMRFLVTGSPYCLILSEGTVLKITRRIEGLYNKAGLMEDLPSLVFNVKDSTATGSLFDIEDGRSFTFSYQKKTAQKPANLPKPKKPAVKEPALAPELHIPVPKAETESGRKRIKNIFARLSDEKKLSNKEIKNLSTTAYCYKVFGIRAPILKELKSRAHLKEQRLINGKVKYWKEEFFYNGKNYLIFKEWLDRQHRIKFDVWLKSVEDVI